ncbi:MAG: dTDP-4-dehydrorhamnose 3,5-epimerase [Bacteroidetes bacterium RIFCSPLOWO2_02_FULL_36_8]|nr:MAG: dTDP-4-dehydrorhamnose 3,5-epimerase [Bacteroidetes bacterium RIFCSPLOWO2_02_FULL_36_8]OFY70224.1 MAG: dTDP-4-dehydrorhamnose 3,5-epimerase [Bacteroidetes bacterium RIFCSPLOWO2_12_FULL_37_12]
MKIEKTPLDGLLVIYPKVFKDPRGEFFESYRKDLLYEQGLKEDFVQDNQSVSSKNTVRGLHYQHDPYAQGKLVTVIIGKVIDVAVDIRKGSPTFGKSFAIEISDKNRLMFFIPNGFAHGFSVLEDNTVFYYKCTNYYHKESEGGIIYNDPDINIDWKVQGPVVSEKDLKLPLFREFESPFVWKK